MIGDIRPVGLRLSDTITHQQIRPGTIRRILPYAKRYRWALVLLLIVTTLDAVITVASPLMLRLVIDNGILPHHLGIVVELSLIVAGLALVDALALYVQTWCSSRIGQGLLYDLRTELYRHVQRQSLAFFVRAQTGSLVSRLDSGVLVAQQAVTTLLSQMISTVFTIALVLAAMFYLSWQISLAAMVLIPLFILPGRRIGTRLQRLTRESMQVNAEMGTLVFERCNVAGAMLTKLYGRPEEESGLFERVAGQLRDVITMRTVYGRMFFIIITLVTALTTALVYGLGGGLAISGALQIGTLVAMVTLLTRLYGPISQISSMQADILTALVSFDRIFEVLDHEPLIAERAGASPLAGAGSDDPSAPEIEFDRVCFRYPAARDVALPSLETVSVPTAEQTSDAWILREVSFRVPAGKLTALVGPSGAGKTTITHLVPRLYDPGSGTVRIGGRNVRDLTFQSLHDTIGVVTQDSYLFHDTIRANLIYARPGATEQELVEACQAAQIWDMVCALPDRLDTVVGDRGFRLSGGEKQRIALARLLLKAPPVVVLDEATAHLDSESEAAIQQALKIALAGRTSLVIAHRLSTIREASQILVIDAGQILQRGTHGELLAAGGLYADLYRTQFAGQAGGANPAAGPASAASAVKPVGTGSANVAPE
jgi:ATP-binding cassette subfamily B protein